MLTTTLPAPPGQLQIPYQAIVVEKDGNVLVSDWGSNDVLRVNLDSDQIIARLGSQGFWPGQFRAMGGMALDQEGRIYVADWQHRVIERFTPDGKIDSDLVGRPPRARATGRSGEGVSAATVDLTKTDAGEEHGTTTMVLATGHDEATASM